MLKKFNLLFEEVTKNTIRNFRFRGNSFIGTYITDEEKDELNKKYDKLVKNELEEAISSNKNINVCSLTQNGWTRNDKEVTIEKLFEKDGTLYCSYFTRDYENKLKEFEERSKTDNFKYYYPNPEDIEREKERALSNYCIVVPISNITTDNLDEVIWADAKVLKEKEKERYQNSIKNAKFESNLQYLIDSGYIKAEKIIDLLLYKNSRTEQIKLNYSARNDEKVLSLFKIDKNSKEYKNYLESQKQTSEQWYYGGGTILDLFVKLTVSEGERYDLKRIINIEFVSSFDNKEGAGTVGEF